MKLGTQGNYNKKNSLVTLSFSVFDWKYPFLAQLIQTIKVVNNTKELPLFAFE